MSRNTYETKIIDGLEVTVHGKNNVIETMRDLFVGALFKDCDESKPEFNGLSIETTEITHELSTYDIQQRIESAYFAKTFAGMVGEGKDIACAVDQMSRNVQNKEFTDLAFGRLYAQTQHLFAKLDINKLWTLTMENPLTETSLLESTSRLPQTGILGRWRLKFNTGDALSAHLFSIGGQFHLGAKDHVLNTISKTRIKLRTPTQIAHASKHSFSDELSKEFDKRWGHVIKGRVEFEFFSGNVQMPLPEDNMLTMMANSGKGQSLRPSDIVDQHRMSSLNVETVEWVNISDSRQAPVNATINVYGTISTVKEVVVLDEATEAGTWMVIKSVADDGETFTFLVGAKHEDHYYKTGIYVTNLSDIKVRA